MRRGADRDGGYRSAPSLRPSRVAFLCERLVAAGLLASTAFTGIGAFVGISLPLVTSAPAGAVSPCGAGCHTMADDRPPDDGDGPTIGRGEYACNGHDRDPYRPSDGHRPVVKTVTVTEPDGSTQHYTTAGADKHGDESLVNQGATVAVTITWDPSAFKGGNVDRVRDCVYSTSSPRGSPYGSGRDLGTPRDAVPEPAPNNGTFTTSYTITQTPGTTVCDWGQVSGGPAAGSWAAGTWNDITEQSAQLCFTVEMPAVTPEVPSVLLLPASAGLVGLGAFWLDRRRRSKASTA
jgi:hypothetical protein